MGSDEFLNLLSMNMVRLESRMPSPITYLFRQEASWVNVYHNKARKGGKSEDQECRDLCPGIDVDIGGLRCLGWYPLGKVLEDSWISLV